MSTQSPGEPARRLTIATGPLLPVPAIGGGSVHRMWELLAPQFAAAGWDTTVCARSWPDQPVQEQRDGVHYLRWGGFAHGPRLLSNLWRDLRYAAGLRSRLPAAEVLVVNDVMLPLLARRRSGRMLVSVNRFPKGQLALWRRAHRLVAPSQAIADAIAQQSPSLAARTVLIPNAFPLADFQRHDAQPRQPRSVLYVGRLHPEKGVHTLLAAAHQLHRAGHPLRLTLVGPHEPGMGGGGEDFLRQLQAQAAGLEVRFVGPVFERERLAQLYRNHLVFCYPSAAEQGEAAPVAPLEAMAAGCVPVVAALPCYGGMLRSGHNSLSFEHHHPAHVEQLASALQHLLDDEPLREQLATQASQDAREYDVAPIALRWLTLFEQSLQQQDDPH